MTVKTDKLEAAVRAAVGRLCDEEMNDEAEELKGLLDTLRTCQLMYHQLMTKYGMVYEERNMLLRRVIELESKMKGEE